MGKRAVSIGIVTSLMLCKRGCGFPLALRYCSVLHIILHQALQTESERSEMYLYSFHDMLVKLAQP